jgi:hypothetical protein
VYTALHGIEVQKKLHRTTESATHAAFTACSSYQCQIGIEPMNGKGAFEVILLAQGPLEKKGE